MSFFLVSLGGVMLTWCEALNWVLVGQGAIAAVLGAILSILAEYTTKYATLCPRTKRLIMVALCFFIPIIALLLAWASNCIAQPTGDAVWQAVYAGALTFLASQIAHTIQLSRFPKQ